jgi:branched-chain amino acid transport system permease protein
MIREFLQNPKVKRVGMIIAIAIGLAVMTGPEGNGNAPTSGITGSFSVQTSFFGFFTTYRWIVFTLFTLIVLGVIWLVKFATRSWRNRTWFRGLGYQAIKRADDTIRAYSRKKPTQFSFYGVVLIFAIYLPHLVTDNSWQTNIVQQIFVYILLAIGLNVVTGFAGLLDLGYVAFYAIGAYTTAWVTGALPTPPPFHIIFNTFYAIPFAIVFAMLFGVLLGIPTLRLRGDYLAIVTLGFGEIIALFANNLFGITGGATGTGQIPYLSIHLGPLKYQWGLSPEPYYYLTLGFVVLFLIVFSSLEHSRVGRTWVAIREDEVAAESLGINPLKYKVMAFAIGAASAGFAGVVTASQTLFVQPGTFSLVFSINILVLVIFGGMGSIMGVVLGGLVIQFFVVYLEHSPPSGYQSQDLYMYLGALLVIMMIFRPAGLFPSRRRRREVSQIEAGTAPDAMMVDIGPHNRVQEGTT